MRFAFLFFLLAMLAPGLDHRFGWTRAADRWNSTRGGNCRAGANPDRLLGDHVGDRMRCIVDRPARPKTGD
jgi:hypothetical protein